MEPVVGVDERAFRGHLERPDFQIGEVKGQWHLAGIDWPHPVIAVRAEVAADHVARRGAEAGDLGPPQGLVGLALVVVTVEQVERDQRGGGQDQRRQGHRRPGHGCGPPPDHQWADFSMSS